MLGLFSVKKDYSLRITIRIQIISRSEECTFVM